MLLMNWRRMFIPLGTIGLFVAVIWWFIYKKQRIETNISYRRTQKVSIINALKNKNVILLCIGNLCSSYAYWLFLTWLPFIL